MIAFVLLFIAAFAVNAGAADSIQSGQELGSNQYIESANSLYRFYLQGDGNLVLRDQQTGSALWASNTNGQSGTRLVMQSDGNLVLYTSADVAVWDSNTNGTSANLLRLNDNGSLILYNGSSVISTIYAGNGGGGGSDQGWKFIVYGDTRSHDSTHRDVLESVMQNTPDYKFMINVGDVVEDGESSSQWDTWEDAVKDELGSTGQSTTPPKYMSCPGNHDELDHSAGRSNWKNFLPGQQQYGNNGQFFVFDYENARFVIMDSDASSITGSQLDMLNDAINNNPKTWLFTVWHNPIFPFGEKPYEDDLHDIWGIPLYEGGCDIMFMGHAHYYVRTHKINMNGDSLPPLDDQYGTAQVITGNAANHVGISEGDRGYMVAGSTEDYGYTELTVDGDIMQLRHINRSGAVIDQEIYTPNPKNGLDPDSPISASGQNPPNETKDKAFDGDISTKWLCFADTAWIQYDYSYNGGSAKVINSYSITSANDAPERDPKDWHLLASNDGSNWTTLDSRSSETFTSRFQTRTFTFSNLNAYKIYRLDIISNLDPDSANSTQLAELEFFEGSGPSTYYLTVSSGSGDGNYQAGASVTITANFAPSGQVFSKWVVNSGSPAIADIYATSTTLIMPASAAAVTATYKDSGGSSEDNNLVTDGELTSGQSLISSNSQYRLTMQTDGNLVLYDESNTPLWDSGTNGQAATRLVLQSDGNLVLYTSANVAVWASNTVGSGASTLRLNDDGSLVLYNGDSVVEYLHGSGGGGGDGDITHIGTTEVWDSNGQNVTIARPSGSKAGDLLVLVLHRTDDDLPLYVDGWTRVAECYKRDNGYDCSTEEDCIDWANSEFCDDFGGHGGHDLAQAVFYRAAGPNEPSSYQFDLNMDSSGHPGWAILTALRGADTIDPVRDWSYKGNDGNPDSVFPSVYGKAGDMVLLSQSFDDAVAQSKFQAPTGTSTFGYVSNSDEAGFLFGGTLVSTGDTGTMKTHGDGASENKDALVSLTIKPGSISSTYVLTVSSGSGDGSYEAGTNVTITANTAPSGQEFDKWVVSSGNPTIANVNASVTTLTMPSSNLTVTATYKDLPPSTYALTVSGGSGDGNYQAGANVTITADTAPSGQVFDKWVVNSGSPTIANVNASSTTLTMPAGNVSVTATYKDDGGGGNDYCTSSGNNTNYEWIAGVHIGTLNNTSGASGYTDFTSKTLNVSADDTVSVSLTPGFSGSSYNESWKIWIDYNFDGDFEDTGEEVLSKSGSSTVSGSLTVSGSATGVTRMRVSMKYNAAPSCCETFTYGEVEDYTINISGGTQTYALTVSGGSGDGSYEAGANVTITANTAPSGQEFDKWVVNSGNPAIADLYASSTTLTMPAGAVAVTATYKDSGGSSEGNSLATDEELLSGQSLKSSNGQYRLTMQASDGNLVLYNASNIPLWASNTSGQAATRLVMQSDGNLVIYTSADVAVWASNTNGTSANLLRLNDDGSLLIYDGSTVIKSIYSGSGGGGGDTVDATTLDNKIMAGYQGWFNADGDGAGKGWRHWSSSKPNADNISFDMWPDLREYDADELYDTSFKYSNGSNAGLYSAYNTKTVERHCKWMQDYGIDGVFVQRFIGEATGSFINMRDRVLQNIRSGAEKYGRVFANMYDISGGDENSLVDDIKNDWIHLVDDLKITESSRYLRHNGRPVLSIWGFNVSGRPGTSSQAKELIQWLTTGAPEKYRATVKLGVDDDWRGDSSDWQAAYRSADIISPWAVGRYGDNSGADSFRNNKIEPDLADLNNENIDYMPVVFPGFSWWNLQNGDSPLNKIPRNGGSFLWRQFFNTVDAGCNMVYVAMFDEVDEGTAIFKVTENDSQTPTTGNFVTMDQDGETLPSDWYLQLTGEASKMLRNEIGLSPTIPISPNGAGYVLTVGSGSGDGNYQSGQSVTITADTAPSGQEFDQWVVNSGSPQIANVNASSTTLTMPAGNVTVSATYKDDGGGGNEYCTSSGNNTSYEWIAGVHIGTLNNTSGASGYTDFTSQTLNVSANDSVSVSLTPGFSGSSYTEYWKIWIDYNQDGDFEDSGEEVLSNSGSSSVSGSFTVSGSVTGATRMRVSMSYNAAPPYCGTFSYGEVEDYTINISGGSQTYTLSVSNGSGDGNYEAGTNVSITANSAPSGQVFDKWVVSSGSPVIANVNASSTTLTMPAGNVTLTATYKDTSGEVKNVVLPANGGVLVSFTSEYGSGWVASDLTNGVTNEDGWASEANPSAPQEFVYSFDGGQSATLNEAVIYGGTAEGLYYSKDVQVWTSADGNNYTKAASGTLGQSDDTITLSLGGVVAKMVKLIVTSGYRSDYWELGEFVVNGVLGN